VPAGEPLPRERCDVQPPLEPDWTETFSYAFAVTNGTVETQIVGRISGPFSVDLFTVHQSGADGRQARVYLAVDDDDSAATSALALGAKVPRASALDTAPVLTPGFGSNTTGVQVVLKALQHRGTSRLSVVCDNATAAAISIWGAIVITHFRRREPLAARA
jgi:hypothetical protein